MARKDSADEAIRITSVGSSRAEDTSRRQRNYLISMTIRVVCFLSAVLLFEGWMRWVMMVAAVFLPYVAVVFANGEDQRKETFGVTSPDHHELPGSRPQEL